MKLQPLSIAPYYGGKYKMSGLLCDMIDYDNTDIFITPFGGMCRVLLNKAPHKKEIYNDSSRGLCTLIEVLSNRKNAEKLMDFLYDTEYTEEWFKWAVEFRNIHEDNRLQGFIHNTGKLLRSLDKQYNIKDILKNVVAKGEPTTIYDRLELSRVID